MKIKDASALVRIESVETQKMDTKEAKSAKISSNDKLLLLLLFYLLLLGSKRDKIGDYTLLEL
jgi:hypothetical protein